MRRRRPYAIAAAPALVAVVVSGCAAILGLDEPDFVGGAEGDADASGSDGPRGGEGGAGGDGASNGEGGDGGGPDAPKDGPRGDGPCDPTAPFKMPQPLGTVNGTSADNWPRLTDDELTLVFASTRGGPFQYYQADRTARTSPFGSLRELTELGGGGLDVDPMISGDGLTVFFATKRSLTKLLDLFWSTRLGRSKQFAMPNPVPAVNSNDDDFHPFFLAADDSLWFTSTRAAGNARQVYRAPSDKAGAFETPVAVGELVADTAENPVLSKDGLTIFFASTRAGGKGQIDIWKGTRSSLGGTFGSFTNVAELNTSSDDIPGWVSNDGCRLYFHSDRPGTLGLTDMYVAERPPF